MRAKFQLDWNTHLRFINKRAKKTIDTSTKKTYKKVLKMRKKKGGLKASLNLGHRPYSQRI